MNTPYVIITPVRDEERYIGKTMEAVIGQSIRPTEWVIVDDGSTDKTTAVIEQYATSHAWIHLQRRANRGYRQSGAGVVEAFYEGYDNLQSKDWSFVVKLDGDLSFAANYFEKMFEHFRDQPRLGIGGGNVYHLVDGKMQLEQCPRFHVRGATKVYRRQCWNDINHLWVAPGWDTIDEVKANMLGWTTKSFAELHVVHHRFTGTAESLWKNLVKDGKADYFSGYHPLFMAAKCGRRLFTKPYIVRSIGIAAGFISGYLNRSPRVDDLPLIEFLRRQQLNRLLGMETMWK